MTQNFIVCIGRQYGSGGREIGAGHGQEKTESGSGSGKKSSGTSAKHSVLRFQGAAA